MELEQLPLVDWMTNYLMTQMLTTPLYTYRPEERMQMQRMDDISSPAVRIHYTERPHVFTLRLSWTRRQVSAPAPEERRAADRVPEEAEAKSQEDMRKDATHISEAEHAILAALFKKNIVTIATYILQSRREREDWVQQVVRSLHPCSPGRPVSSYALSAAHKYEA